MPSQGLKVPRAARYKKTGSDYRASIRCETSCVPESLTPDLEDTPCSIAGCFEVADLIATGDALLPPLAIAPGGKETITLEIPLCVEHAHLLRLGVRAFNLDTPL